MCRTQHKFPEGRRKFMNLNEKETHVADYVTTLRGLLERAHKEKNLDITKATYEITATNQPASTVDREAY